VGGTIPSRGYITLPTDNLDLPSVEVLRQGLESYQGTVLAVTHDRWFARSFHRFLVFTRDGDAPGNTFVRDLRQGETLLVQPSSLLYRDVTVRLALHLEYPRNRGFAFWHSRWSYRTIWVRLWGPGRVAVQSVYQPPEDTDAIVNHSYATTNHW
jgi:hypothetical protein